MGYQMPLPLLDNRACRRWDGLFKHRRLYMVYLSIFFQRYALKRRDCQRYASIGGPKVCSPSKGLSTSKGD